jgi:succinate dehydrogenase / fumarate reductase membrane anchor subunit
MLGHTVVRRSGEGAWLWLIKILSGVLVFTLLMVHLIVNHFTAEEALLGYDEVVAYLSNPWIALMEISFLIIVVTHALVGTRSVILDLKPARPLLRALDWLFVVVGVVSIGFGIWLVRVIVSQGAGG